MIHASGISGYFEGAPAFAVDFEETVILKVTGAFPLPP
jgi:hypothetical protein